MQLIRWGQAYKRQVHNSFSRVEKTAYGSQAVRAYFRAFGHGMWRTSDFAVDIEWDDVTKIIRQYARLGHPEAVRVQSAIRLADAAEEAGWRDEGAPKSH